MMMIHGSFRFAALGIFLSAVVAPNGSWAVTTITSIDFKNNGDRNDIEIQGDGPITYTQEQNDTDQQIVLNLSDVALGPNAMRPLDTSSFDSPIALISPYVVEEGQARIVIQLRSAAASTVALDGNNIRVTVMGSGAIANAEPEVPPPVDAELTPPDSAATAATDTPPAPPAKDPNKPAEIEDYIVAKKELRFSGKPVTLKARQADVRDILRLIGEASGFNMVIASDVTGNITISLENVPWDQALDVVLETMRLGAERSHNVLRITTLTNLTREKIEQLKAKEATHANAPRVTKVFSINYAELDTMKNMITAMTMSGGSGEGGAGGGQTVQTDSRTNSLVIQDTPENIDRVAKLLNVLDVQTPQVLVEAKVIEASEGYSWGRSGSFGVSNNGGDVTNAGRTTQFFAGVNGSNPADRLLGSVTTGTGIATNSAASSLFGFSPNLNFLSNNARLNATLSLGEQESQVKVVSSPRTIVLNKTEANIIAGTPVLIKTSGVSQGVPFTNEQVQEANLSLTVTPTVTNDDGVLMDLTVERSIPQPVSDTENGIATRRMKTRVLVKSGSTLVIGGIYSMNTQRSEGGFPVLRKIPIIGWLFGSDSESTSRTELFIFVTPRVLNSKAAGLVASSKP